MKRLILTILFCMTLFPVFAGGGAEGGDASGSSVKIGVTIYKYDDNFMAVVRRNMEEAAAAIGVELLMNDSQNDQAKQNDQVDVLINKGVNALAINLVDPAAAGTIIAKAKAAKVPLVFFNKEPSADDLASYDLAYYVGTNSAESGIIQGELIAAQWAANPAWDANSDGVLQYVLLKGEPGHPDAEARTKYSVETINEKGIQTEELFLDTGMWDAAQARDKTEAWLSGPKGAQIEVVIANNDGMAFGAIEALRSNERTEVPVFGVDALDEAIEKIKAGEMAGTVLNDAVNQAKATVELAANLGAGKAPLEGTSWELDEVKAVRVPYVAVDHDSIK